MATITLQHPTHEHPLVPLEFSDNIFARGCCLCQRLIFTEAYTCEENCLCQIYHRVCAEAPLQIDCHPLHPIHPLTLSHLRPSFECDACGELFRFGGSSFWCEECDFDLDISCALSTLPDRGGSQSASPEQIALLRFHPHWLTSFSTRHDFVLYDDCVICRASVDEDGYMCLDRRCEFIIHNKCIQDLFYFDETKSLLQHPTHDHPLVPLDFRLEPITKSCDLCLRKISAEAYTCEEDCDSYYHRACAEAPPQIEHHPLHLAHPLTLLHFPSSFECDACYEINSYGGSSFRCDECDFKLDISCALSTLLHRGGSQGCTTPEQITLPLHPHPLTLFNTRHDYVGDGDCVICKESVKGDGYMCLNRSCEFLIHKRCIQDLYYADGTKAPRIYHRHQLEVFVGEDTSSSRCEMELISCASCKVSIRRDVNQVPEILYYPPHPDHSLVLFINPLGDHARRCGSCSSYLEGEWYYGCTSCDFSVHVQCVLQTLAYCEEGMSASIQWNWHEHPLFLCHKTESVSQNCSYCGDESTGPTYACKERACGFLLHQRCVKIKATIINPHHPNHLLTLRRGTGRSPPVCEACSKTIVGFNFSCELCAFYLHVKCAAHVPTKKHYLHEHELLHLDEAPSWECNRCGTSTDLPFFRCVPCNFNLHEKCMELPQVVKHDTHVHPLTLRETYIEDDSGEYYCDLCGERRDGRLGVYVCEICKVTWAFQIECVLPELRKVYVKTSQTFAIERLDERIMSKNEEARAAEEKLEEVKRELDEMMKRRDELISGEGKNYVNCG